MSLAVSTGTRDITTPVAASTRVKAYAPEAPSRSMMRRGVGGGAAGPDAAAAWGAACAAGAGGLFSRIGAITVFFLFGTNGTIAAMSCRNLNCAAQLSRHFTQKE